VVISAPAAGSQATVGQTLQVQSLATDSVGVTRVDLQVDGVVVRSDTSPDPNGQKSLALLQNWAPTQLGQHTITLIAYRADGTASLPVSVTIDVAQAGAGPTSSPTIGPCTAQTTTDLNVRGGPSTAYPILGVLAVGKSGAVKARNNDSSWWQIAFAGGPDGLGWVSSVYVTLSGDCTGVTIGSFPPPPPTNTPTPTATSAPAITNTPAPADLIVTAIDMPGNFYLVGGKAAITLKVTIQNVGATTAGNFNTLVYPTGVGGPGGQIDLGTLATLDPGQSLTLTASFTYTVVGTYTVEAVVDANNTVSESDEGNNIRTFAIQVSPLPPSITVTP
jgi:uncharacterized protein YraI